MSSSSGFLDQVFDQQDAKNVGQNDLKKGSVALESASSVGGDGSTSGITRQASSSYPRSAPPVR